MSRAVRPWEWPSADGRMIGFCWTTVRVSPSKPPVSSSTPASAPAPASPPTSAMDRTVTVRSMPPSVRRGRESELKLGLGGVERAQGPRGHLDVRGGHQRLADEHRVDADALELVELRARGVAGFRHH